MTVGKCVSATDFSTREFPPRRVDRQARVVMDRYPAAPDDVPCFGHEPRVYEAGGAGHHRGRNAVDRGVELIEVAEAIRKGADQAAGLVHYLLIADPGQASRANGPGLGVGRLEVGGREVEAHHAGLPVGGLTVAQSGIRPLVDKNGDLAFRTRPFLLLPDPLRFVASAADEAGGLRAGGGSAGSRVLPWRGRRRGR